MVQSCENKATLQPQTSKHLLFVTQILGAVYDSSLMQCKFCLQKYETEKNAVLCATVSAFSYQLISHYVVVMWCKGYCGHYDQPVAMQAFECTFCSDTCQ